MKEKKKVLYLITKGNFGGAQRYVYDLAVGLLYDKFKFEPVVACGPGKLLIERLKDLKIKTIEIESLQREVSLKNDFKVIKEIVKIIKEERPNVVHLNSSKIGFLGAAAILYLRIFQSFHLSIPKSVFTAHGWAFNERNRSTFCRFIYYLAHYFTVLICNATIAVSEKAKKEADFPFIQHKIEVIYNGIKPFKRLPKEEARVILASQDSEKTILFSISELHYNKGLDVAFRALALLPQEIKEKLIYCIAGPGEEKENLEKLAIELNISDLVRFLGFLPNAKELLPSVNIFLLPSRTEAFPYVLLEAGLAGLPVIATNIGGIPEVIRDMQNGILIHAKNPKEIAEAITYLLDHPDRQKEFGQGLKKTVTENFSLEKMLNKTIDLYNKLTQLEQLE